MEGEGGEGGGGDSLSRSSVSLGNSSPVQTCTHHAVKGLPPSLESIYHRLLLLRHTAEYSLAVKKVEPNRIQGENDGIVFITVP